ncbi:Nucleotide-binding universal stress protein, UspA family [Collimonas sp. OK242]|jgi:nucleotide-binding universal stress UspA family protein|uniref:universal stress protein n=1 Tax=Collimonas sp. OK242 TaxID=1798195 RepID=UPI000899CE3F|nr:universal stress protein [Collimonas sp. OK242]SDY56878.1 Nucleotide-binding universal stress protein, UspA family [Collimonas sp. OK242]
MFKHILLPTDGSLASEISIQQGVRLAKEINARVTGVYIIPAYHVMVDQNAMLGDSEEQVDIESTALALQFLEVIEREARRAGVQCDSVHAINDRPYEGILKMADDKGCDLIAMASHGRTGARALLMGSQTLKVLTHSKVPVLVFR